MEFYVHTKTAVVLLILVAGSSSAESGIDCDFEQDLCQWRVNDDQGENLRIRWNRVSWCLDMSVNCSGALMDHTTDFEGSYISVKPRSGNKGGSALLYREGSLASSGQSYCFSFYYHIVRGRNMGQLKVILRDSVYDDTSYVDHVLWALDGPSTDDWHPAQVNVSDKYIKGNFTIMLDATFDPGSDGGFLVDDTKLDMTECQTSPVEADVSDNPNSTVTSKPVPTSSSTGIITTTISNINSTTTNNSASNVTSTNADYTSHSNTTEGWGTTTAGEAPYTSDTSTGTWKLIVGVVIGVISLAVVVTGILLYLRHIGKICDRSFPLTQKDMEVDYRVSAPVSEYFNTVSTVSEVTLLDCKPVNGADSSSFSNGSYHLSSS